MPIKNPEFLKEARARAEEKRKDTRFRLWEFVAFCDLDKVSQAWKDRYQQAFGKPYIDTREEQSKDASENVKAEHDAGLWEHGD